jgi:hypothetical protein
MKIYVQMSIPKVDNSDVSCIVENVNTKRHVKYMKFVSKDNSQYIIIKGNEDLSKIVDKDFIVGDAWKTMLYLTK